MNPYDILGCNPGDSDATIKKAYKKLALKYHPDKNGDADKFNEIVSAYNSLGNRAESQDINFDDIFMSNIFSNIFKKFSEVASPDPAGYSHHTGQGSSAKAYLKLSLEEIYSGGTFNVEYKCINIIGMTASQIGGFQILIPEEEVIEGNVEISVPPGHNPDDPIIQHNFTECHGDLIVRIIEKKHDLFERDSNHLKLTLEISLIEALTGFKRSIKHLNGSDWVIQSGSVISPGEIKTIPQEGINSQGDLFITFKVIFPKYIDDDTKIKLKELNIDKSCQGSDSR